VAVDTALLTIADGRLQVVLTNSDHDLRLPGTFLHRGEVLADAVHRSLRDKVGVTDVDARQLRVFDRLDRDERGWVLSVAHVAAVRSERLPLGEGLRLRPVQEVGDLKYDHNEIVERAVEWVRLRYAAAADPEHLLPEEFTLLELQQLHEIVSGVPQTKDGFRRRMVRNDLVVETERTTVGTIGKPARYFRRA
jgi:ADP-ribose pyrophosphatase YjhB (NUDIX family)